ncbi:MAG: hypothetical protein MI861_18960 [Pirellulales bacterium]|nr:hypothetical protein [Pirellulales bacterium]
MTAIESVFGFSALAKMLGVFLMAVLPVRVTTDSGQTVQGDLMELTEAGLALQRDGEIVEFEFEDLISLHPVKEPERVGPKPRVTLLNGSTITADRLALADDVLMIEPRRQEAIRVDAKMVKAIRFHEATPQTDPQWLGLLTQQGRGDVLAVRREEDRIDSFRGVVLSIQDKKVMFDLDGEELSAPMDRLEGVIFGGGGGSKVADNAEVQVVDVWGSTWLADRILPSQGDQPIRLDLGNSLQHSIPLSQIQAIRWSSGQQMLSQLPPAQRSFQPYFQSQVDSKLLDRWFSPRGDGESDLLMYGGSKIEYRIEAGFETLVGSVVREPGSGQAGQVTVRVLIDDKVQWEEEIRGTDALGFELAVGDARRVQFEVDSGDDGDLGDTVRIRRPRLKK